LVGLGEKWAKTYKLNALEVAQTMYVLVPILPALDKSLLLSEPISFFVKQRGAAGSGTFQHLCSKEPLRSQCGRERKWWNKIV
jgi:hypothetical protein